MPSDPSWDIMPVANPALRAGKRRRLIRSSCAYDPVGLTEPLYQRRHRDQCAVPSALDRMSRELLIRAQAAIGSALDSVTDDAVESTDIVTELTLRRHEWQIAIALRHHRAAGRSRVQRGCERWTHDRLGPRAAAACPATGSGRGRVQGHRAGALRSRGTRGQVRVPGLAGRAPDIEPE